MTAWIWVALSLSTFVTVGNMRKATLGLSREFSPPALAVVEAG